jgi:hypothetical protein
MSHACVKTKFIDASCRNKSTISAKSCSSIQLMAPSNRFTLAALHFCDSPRVPRCPDGGLAAKIA